MSEEHLLMRRRKRCENNNTNNKKISDCKIGWNLLRNREKVKIREGIPK